MQSVANVDMPWNRHCKFVDPPLIMSKEVYNLLSQGIITTTPLFDVFAAAVNSSLVV